MSSITVWSRHGLRIIVLQTGTIGRFDFQTLLLTFVGGFGLMAVGARMSSLPLADLNLTLLERLQLLLWWTFWPRRFCRERLSTRSSSTRRLWRMATRRQGLQEPQNALPCSKINKRNRLPHTPLWIDERSHRLCGCKYYQILAEKECLLFLQRMPSHRSHRCLNWPWLALVGAGLLDSFLDPGHMDCASCY